ncbi:hypothetical protein U9M48_034596 [Paspalum notatum var. saurae]|uniref:Uncharacterized protein n=1 Tax=Paspalum notatum var. saurae TaxID=547442 RepID=A0AAQ3UAB2_PASNO
MPLPTHPASRARSTARPPPRPRGTAARPRRAQRGEGEHTASGSGVQGRSSSGGCSYRSISDVRLAQPILMGKRPQLGSRLPDPGAATTKNVPARLGCSYVLTPQLHPGAAAGTPNLCRHDLARTVARRVLLRPSSRSLELAPRLLACWTAAPSFDPLPNRCCLLGRSPAARPHPVYCHALPPGMGPPPPSSPWRRPPPASPIAGTGSLADQSTLSFPLSYWHDQTRSNFINDVLYNEVTIKFTLT